ncbi:hypothetical protein DUNSADRAFT_10939 [Dunaliella salina]|uniref:Encoded protein n=1 Tax=Dunaliella salina TaxID=3046 RepID=A0ABQ7GEI9_DUNSA|nr:hypothetical protein DUNSADRAFT_10939 [Dunaliella salina]|eukprot:KAF5833018.1 hypothetical protein DUNSADRAFT_10939 [Dunaliella salina]
MAHFTGFLSCALGNKMPLSPKQVWLIHRDMLWSPGRAQQHPPPAAVPQSSGCPVAMAGRASSSPAVPSTACPMMTTDRPSVGSDSVFEHDHGCPEAIPGRASSSPAVPWAACPMMTTDRPSVHSDSSFEHDYGCPVAMHGRASSSPAVPWATCPMITTDRPSGNSDSTAEHDHGCPEASDNNHAASTIPATWPGACPMKTTSRLSADSDSTVVLNGCPIAHSHSESEEESGPPILGPYHVGNLIEMLRDALTELNAQEELINETTNLLHSVSWVFERGDVFHDPNNEEKQWHDSNNAQECVDINKYTGVDPWLLVAATVENC